MGPSLRDLVAAKDAALAEKTTQQIAASVAATEGIQAPFDREIIGGKEAPGRQRIQKAIDSLTQQSKDLVAAANAIGITKLTLVQPLSMQMSQATRPRRALRLAAASVG